jgi:hypothetical protein
MSLRDWFRAGTSWRDKAGEVAARLAETMAAIERLRGEAATLTLDTGFGRADAEQRLGEIEREIGLLSARQNWQQQALAEAEAKAEAEEAAAEAERRRGLTSRRPRPTPPAPPRWRARSTRARRGCRWTKCGGCSARGRCNTASA